MLLVLENDKLLKSLWVERTEKIDPLPAFHIISKPKIGRAPVLGGKA
jgi:hypothetical protein